MRRTYGTDKTAELKIKIEHEGKEWLVKQANQAGITMAEYVRRIINEQRQKTA